MPKTKNSNVFLFYGEDDFSLRRKVDLWKAEFAKKYSAQAVVFVDAANLTPLEKIKKIESELAPSLFATKKLVIIRDAFPKSSKTLEKTQDVSQAAAKTDQDELSQFLLNLPGSLRNDCFVVFWQTTSLDGRLKFTKSFKEIVNVTEFSLPHGPALNAWIMGLAKTLGVEISPEASDLLAVYMGRDLYEEKKIGGRVVERREAFDLWQVSSELAKLSASTNSVTSETVKALVRAKIPDSIFILSDSLARKDPKAALVALDNFLTNATEDEKNSFIKIVGLLSEQFRGLLLVKALVADGLPQAKIADRLGWSSGRVFVLNKNAQNFTIEQLIRALKGLLEIDLKLKSTDQSPRLLVDEFIVNQNQA